jgi:hypothetical protein
VHAFFARPPPSPSPSPSLSLSLALVLLLFCSSEWCMVDHHAPFVYEGGISAGGRVPHLSASMWLMRRTDGDVARTQALSVFKHSAIIASVAIVALPFAAQVDWSDPSNDAAMTMQTGATTCVILIGLIRTLFTSPQFVSASVFVNHSVPADVRGSFNGQSMCRSLLPLSAGVC